MPVFCPFTTKTFEETQRGELIYFPNEAPPHDWGIIIGPADGGRHQFALLASRDRNFPAFSIAHQEDGTECISFGMEWVFEPLPLAGPMSRELRETVGCWIVQGDTVSMRFARHAVQRGTTVLSLETMEPANVGRFFAFGGRYWRLWASDADRTSLRSAPLIEVLP